MSATSETLQDQDAVNSAVASFSGQQHHPVVRCDVKIGWITNFHLPSFAISWDLVMSIPLLHPLTVGIRAIYCWFVSSTFPEVDEISLPSLWSEQGSRPEILEAVQQWTREGSSSYRQQASWLSLHITQNMPNIYHIYISSEACHEINSWILSWAFVSRSGRPPYQFVQAMPIGESGFEQDGGCVQFFVLKMMMYQVPITSRWIKWLLYRHPDTSTSPFGILMSSFFANLWRGLHDFQLLQGS